ncbi:hypothetical protein BDB00DRAFT_829184 [Zychaea mexicana]|uniref:uncharacterized protein n=1 Tax=Zychaea mexicana TaxID=64656 RepID=UPI0022FE208D|nr:uncharacterized protein BDB00DRAFT_829184 [Zychaea mexicana]KAI9492290.1 hypothetical protein BDB00DRAFT_829184 [Zychaea mexicana]
MGAQAVDYRVSRVVVCCKDCGQDVGLYPARHKCQDVVRPPLPPLPTKFSATTSSHDDNLRVPRKPVPSYDSESRSRPTSAASSTSSSTFNQHAPSDTSSATSTGSKWSRFVRSPSNNNMKNGNSGQGDNDDDSFYYNNFAAHLPETSSDSSSPQQSGKKLWGKVRQNEKWKQLNEKCKYSLRV